MKISVDVECTPEELRAFLGLPDVQPMQQALMRQMQDRMAASLAAADPETMLKVWLPAGVQGIEQLQKMFWSQFAAAGGRSRESKS
ncbi:DUF6489 family protein [Phaeospirillum tilakii]|uniref:DUF6489 family protein n=1 Tax=Phaeospirillum tilakii TaxID=741673 RepID=A0ABW5C9P8_9PROT